MSDEITLGDSVVCKVTGFKGIAIGRCEYINGCVSYEVQPKCDADGKVPPAVWIDIQQLTVKAKPKTRVRKEGTARRGGPADRPPARSAPNGRGSRGPGS